MPDYAFHNGQIIEPWVLLEPLGKGGNSQVWKARHEDGRVASVKFSIRKKSNKRYQRFIDEVKLHGTLAPHPGVLPMYAYCLPEQPGNKAPSWLSMPVATPIRDALNEDFELERVVEAIAEVAETLVWLSNQKIYHRDIKPANLYYYDGHWVLGDLGLATFPEKSSVTSSSERLGHHRQPSVAADHNRGHRSLRFHHHAEEDSHRPRHGVAERKYVEG